MKIKDLNDFLNGLDQHYLDRYDTEKTIESLDKLKLLHEEYNEYKNSSNRSDDAQKNFEYRCLSQTKQDIKREIERSRNMQCIFLLLAVSFFLEPCEKLGKNLKAYFNQ